ncbi:hypothetical protein [Agreia sp. Leaf210]|uniref:hypothetical protein n=1 Tax=Agreia sp. Leaf210 TaxID=1735682 RepID=UPI0012E1EB49|nr:hypothetical protein [Agreia sp. Leaf210]
MLATRIEAKMTVQPLSEIPRDRAFDEFPAHTRTWRRANQQKRAEMIIGEWLQQYQRDGGDPPSWSRATGVTTEPGVFGGAPLDRWPRETWHDAFVQAGYTRSTLHAREIRPGVLSWALEVRREPVAPHLPGPIYRGTHEERKDRWSWANSLEVALTTWGNREIGDRIYKIAQPRQLYATIQHRRHLLPNSKIAHVLVEDWDEYILDPGDEIEEVAIIDQPGRSDFYVVNP